MLIIRSNQHNILAETRDKLKSKRVMVEVENYSMGSLPPSSSFLLPHTNTFHLRACLQQARRTTIIA